ncbi:hypothetical protein ABEF81_08790 [Acinetobacter thermotolerans]|uniref:hypothetical protein n=1 Tax=Acinetobacter thermotolerans TaxID=3151487 RepID=UPI00325A4471
MNNSSENNTRISPDWKLVEELGGATKVASLLKFKVQRVQNWKTRDIPAAIKLKYPKLFLKPQEKTGNNAA